MTTKREIRAAAAAMGRKGGKAKSAAKTKAVRENAKLGGRPRARINARLLAAAKGALLALREELGTRRALDMTTTEAQRVRYADRLEAVIAEAEVEQARQRSKA